MPEDDSPSRVKPLLLIVTGSSLRAEEMDRPLAYYLLRQVEDALARSHPDTESRPWVLSDLRWLHDESLQDLPTLSLGGPGVNLLAHRWLEELPISLAVDNEYYIQMDPDLQDLRVSIWGMNNASTQIAVSAFVRRFLPRFLDRCLEVASESGHDESGAEDDD